MQNFNYLIVSRETLKKQIIKNHVLFNFIIVFKVQKHQN